MFHSTILISCLFVAAATARAEEPVELEDLIVTAGLEPILAADVAGSVTIITREDIERRQVKFLADLLRNVPGFAVSQLGGPGTQTQVRVRGAEANQLLVLIDGMRANDPASGDEFQFQYALTSNIERIEIIRGPQSATWGTDALAGVVNIIRRKEIAPDSGYLQGEVVAGSFDTVEAGIDGGIRSGRMQLSGGVAYVETDGSNISRGAGEDDGAENSNANARLEIEAGEAMRLIASGQHVDARSDFDGLSFLTGLPEDADQYTEAERSYLSSEVRFDPESSRWSGSASVNWLDSDNVNFSSGAPNGSTSADSLELRLRASMLLGPQAARGDHRLTLAADHETIDFAQRGTASPFGDPDQDQSYNVTGFAAEYVGKGAERWTWMLSARHDDFSDFDDAATWQLAASRRFDGGGKIRGAVGTGSKAPTFIERFGFFPDLFIGNPDLKPETSEGWEIGFDFPVLDQGITFSATYFRQELEDEIDGFVFDPETFLFTAANRPGSSDRKGVELVLSGQAGEGLTFNASYSYTDATEFGPAGAPSREIRRPRHVASLNLNRVFAAGRGNLNLNVNYNGVQLDNYFPPPTFGLVQVELGSFTVVDLAASWKLTGELELVGRVSNLLDEDYEEVLGFARAGRGIFAGLRVHLAR